jgi:hypothetical protein
VAEPGVTLDELREELYARGRDDLKQDATGRARAARWINQAYAELCLEEPWPFRLTSVSGAAPLEIADVGDVLSVTDTGNSGGELFEMTERELTDWGLTTTTGLPYWFYRDSLTIRVWPASTTTLLVRYWKLPAELVSAADETIVPKRFMGAIVDGAVLRGVADRDNPAAVQLADQMYQRQLALMRRQLLVAPTHIQHVPGTSWDD